MGWGEMLGFSGMGTALKCMIPRHLGGICGWSMGFSKFYVFSVRPTFALLLEGEIMRAWRVWRLFRVYLA